MNGLSVKAVRALILMTGAVLLLNGGAAIAAGKPGETLFNQHCAACHPQGGNIINPQKTLAKRSLETRKILTAEDIVKTMRKPGPGMTKFDARMIPDRDAKQIAEYILATFK